VAVGTFRFAARQREEDRLFVVVRSTDPAPPNESAMKNLVAGYARAVANSAECNH
jgi:hypothetical protein